MSRIFKVWRFVIKVAWAKTGLWANTSDKEKRTHIATVHILERDGNKAVSVIIGPAALIVGFAM